MAKLVPFRGYRFVPETSGKLDGILTQPYDKISDSMLQAYLKRSPYNLARVIKNTDYAQAASYLRDWISQGILRQDSAPSLYPYQQTFDFEKVRFRRLGFIGLVSLESSRQVKGHERILRDPLQDRLRLIRHTESNEGLIFMLYDEPRRRTDEILADFVRRKDPVVRVRDEFGVEHTLWQMSESERCSAVLQKLADRPLYIADGHHRFQTSLIFFEECRQKGWKPAAPESFDRRMIALFNMQDPGLMILPTHRAIRNLPEFDPQDLLSALQVSFDLHRCLTPEEVTEQMKGGSHRLGLLLREGFYWLSLKPQSINQPSFMPEIAGVARSLDVNILHEGILRSVLKIGPEELARQQNVDYHREWRELVKPLLKGKYQAIFLLNPTTLGQVRQISELDQKMPQKSTDFYPKLLSGLVLMRMEIDKKN